MQVVIEIPEEVMEYIRNNNCVAVSYCDELARAIANGTLLQKHGDLIDRDELKGDTEYDEEGVPYAYSMGQVWNATVVIPADNGGAE